MRLIRFLIVLSLVAIGIFYMVEQFDIPGNEATDKISKKVKEKTNLLENKAVPEKRTEEIPLDGDVYQWVDQSTDKLIASFGEPDRKDKSAYGYTWWVYTDQHSQYIQFGIADDKIQTIYATGGNLDLEPVQIGQNYQTVDDKLSFSNEVSYSKGISSYQFKLKPEDMKIRPLAKITDDIFVQCYFDTFTDELSAIRVLTADVLLKHRPYEIAYHGKLPDEPDLSDKAWKQVDTGMEKQIFDLTNVMRNQYGVPTVKWEDTVSEVAFAHSKDMSDNHYFSHDSLDGSGLKERLAVKDVYYLSAGENIAAQYTDAPAAMIGWLNSEGHREALLNKAYTHLGVGVHRLYYTQNFLGKP
jgi:uncharacterized protein YkwD